MSHDARWTAAKIARRLALIEPLVYRASLRLPAFRYLPLDGPDDAPPVGHEADDSSWSRIEPGTYWGEWERDFVLRTALDVPDEWGGGTPLALFLPLGDAGDFSHPEALVYLDGVPIAACDRHHQEVPLPKTISPGHHLLALHGWSGLGGWRGGDQATRLLMRPCALVQIDQPTRDFIATARVALGIADQLDPQEPARDRLYNALDHAFRILDTRDPLGERFYASVPAAHRALRDGIAAAAAPLDVELIAAGHAHIDVAWLWTVDQARRKAGRTFHNVLDLMDRHPGFHFTQSQPQLYEYLEADYPELLGRITDRVGEERWEPIGGMWVEADCNVTGAESLARQLLLGRTYFRERFGEGAESPVLWLPDVFGYAWNLPQLIQEAGLDYFFTIKISWNQYNRIPYDSFWWQGLDGTRVLTHFSTTRDSGTLSGSGQRPSTYNAKVSPLEVMETWRNLQNKGSQHTLLMVYGYGDGGGGPTREMIENSRELASFPAAPRVTPGRAIDFFRRLEEESGDRLPTWNGELYLEYHRGTYTSQARTKRANRKCEILLHDAEFLAAWAAHATDYAYPHADLTRAWKLLCLNQFHDILPGSSIGPVYEDATRDHATIREIAGDIQATALDALGSILTREARYSLVNTTSFGGPRIAHLDEILEPGQTLRDLSTGTTLVTQPVASGTLVEIPHVPGCSMIPLTTAISPERPPPGGSAHAEKRGDLFALENRWLLVELDRSGEITRLFDREREREILPEGARGNLLQAFEDRPLAWDAWDIDAFFEDRQWSPEPAHAARVIENGPLRAGIEVQRRLGESEIVQRIYLYRAGRRIDFVTWVDWHERHVLLKVAFPVDILSPVATYDIQWGNVERPTHRNTSWDWARFESCAHWWVDLSEGDYGVSLLNDCKYGHDIHDNVMRLSLLRGPTQPDPGADLGEHRFTYSLLPHEGNWRSGTVAAAYDLNHPALVRPLQGGGDDPAPRLFSVDSPNVIIETVKRAEDGNGLVVRLYENERSRGPVRLTCSFPVAAAFRCNLLEEPRFALEVTGNHVVIPLRPYEVATVRLVDHQQS